MRPRPVTGHSAGSIKLRPQRLASG
jgi:hypothetical protein